MDQAIELLHRQVSISGSGNRISDIGRSLIAMGRSRKANDQMHIPMRYRCKNLDNFLGMEKQVAVARQAVRAGRSVFLHGPTGTGKTHLGVALTCLWAAQNHPTRVLFVPVVELIAAVRSGLGSNKGEDLSTYINRGLLLLDDMGAEKETEFTRQTLQMLIDRRYRDMGQTIITSNLSLDDIAQRVDDRIASRIVEMGVVINTGGEDYRLKIAEQTALDMAMVK